MSGDDIGQPPRFFRNFIALAGPYWSGPEGWRPRLLSAVLVGLVVIQVVLQIRLNSWSADLFNALERRSTDRALAEIEIFALIVLATMVVNSAHLVVRRHLQLDWRRWLTARVVGEWMQDARHYQAGLIPGDHANPDGRIAEDIRVATEAGIDLASSLLYCTLLLVTFVGILWSLSGSMLIAGVAVPGHLVLLAFIYAGAGAAVAFLLGRPLVRATDTRQTKEADFRFGLVRARESAEPIALARGEAIERSRLAAEFESIAATWRAQSVGLARLLVFSSGYQTLAGVLPLLVGTPRFLAGSLSLGGLVQSAQAFQQVSSALSWPVDNLPLLAAWRASVERVLALQEAVRTVSLEAARTGQTAINLDRAPGDWLGVRELSVAAPDGTAMLSGLTLQVGQGEHVLVDGEPEAAAALFRVLAGIWPWGNGHVDLPADAGMLVAGPRPFLPEGTLRRALAFPEPPGRNSDAALSDALERTGLGHLVERLDETADWGRALNGSEMQRLSFARLLLHRPHWIVLGDATDALDPDSADDMLRLLADELPGSGIVVIGRHPGSADTFDRRMTLHRAADGQVLLHEIYARREAARRPRRRSLGVVDWLRQGYGP
jgi:putative ATP-binding cassette transporter